MSSRTTRFVVAVALFVASLPALGAAAHQGDGFSVTVTRAPVVPDGTAAGELADFVVTFIDPDPDVDGISILSGGTVSMTLPDEFVATGEGPNTLVLLQGWPQSPPAPPPDFIWTTTTSGHTVTATLNADYLVGAFGPGVKQVHGLLSGFRNPPPGRYRLSLAIQPDPASSHVMHVDAVVRIIPRIIPAISAVSVFSGGGPPPPFNNAIYQDVSPGESANTVGLYLWEKGSSVADGTVTPMVGVDVVMQSARHGRLVQGHRTVGHVRIQAPPGAHEHVLATDGPSTAGTAAVTGIDVGILLTQFTTDPGVLGTYRITFRLVGGDSQTLVVRAR